MKIIYFSMNITTSAVRCTPNKISSLNRENRASRRKQQPPAHRFSWAMIRVARRIIGTIVSSSPLLLKSLIKQQAWPVSEWGTEKYMRVWRRKGRDTCWDEWRTISEIQQDRAKRCICVILPSPPWHNVSECDPLSLSLVPCDMCLSGFSWLQ